jgi:hypothetical protein
MLLVELIDDRLGGIDVFGGTPDHVPEIQLDRVGGHGIRAREDAGREGGGGKEPAQRALVACLAEHGHEGLPPWLIVSSGLFFFLVGPGVSLRRLTNVRLAWPPR